MPPDVAVLAGTIVSSFMLPYAKKGIEELGNELSKKFGNSAASQVSGLTQKLWNKVKSVFSADDDKAALSQFEKRPDASKVLIQAILEEKLQQNSSLAEELNELIKTPTTDGRSVTEIMNNSGIVGVVEVKNSDLSHSTGLTITGVSFQTKIEDLSLDKDKDQNKSS